MCFIVNRKSLYVILIVIPSISWVTILLIGLIIIGLISRPTVKPFLTKPNSTKIQANRNEGKNY